MKHKMTLGLAISFVVVSGCVLFGAYKLSGSNSPKVEQEVVAEKTDEMKTENSKEIVSEKTTVETVIATVASKQKQETPLVKEKSNGGSTAIRKEASTTAQPLAETSHSRETTAARETTTEKPDVRPEGTTERPKQDEEPPTPQTPTTEAEKQKATTEEKPRASTEARTTTEATTEREKIWHPEVTNKVWVVDEPAWSETVTYTDYIDCYMCTNCCATFATYDEADAHLDESYEKCVRGEIDFNAVCLAFKTWQKPIERTETFDYPEKGHWETVVVSEGYWE